MPPALYRSLLRLLSPAVLLHTAVVAARERCARYLPQRLGLRLPGSRRRPLWIHCASVGEINTALALAEAWRRTHPDDDVLLTSATITARRLFLQKAPAGMRHCYLPLDYPSLVRRFVRVMRPRCALIMEAEMWLNLFDACAARDIPIIIVNGRLSDKTLRPARYAGAYYRHSLACVRAILAKSARDRDNYIALGATPEKTENCGNLKYAVKPAPAAAARTAVGRPYCLAASTHAGEEIAVAKAWRTADVGDASLVIAPRHPQRCAAIARQLRRAGFAVALDSADARGEQDEDGRDAAIRLFCGIGHLPALMRDAQFVFLGGSLVAKGGHNLLEAARLGTPQATGAHLGQVAEEARALREAGGLLVVNDAAELGPIFARAVRGGYREMADNAAAFLRAQSDVAARYVERLQALGL